MSGPLDIPDEAVLGRVTDAEALAMLQDCSIHELGRRAHEITMRLHPEEYRTYVVDRNINYSNYCTAGCTFCNFSVNPSSRSGERDDGVKGYVLSTEQIGRKIEDLLEIGGTQILLQGGLVPAEMLPFEWYLELLRFIKREYPGIHVHAFSPPEVHAFHRIFGMTVRDVLRRLQDAGLDTIPGGGAEILVDRVRRRTAPGKASVDEYLEVMREAHKIGMRTSITMMFGHLETIPERIEHLRRIRDLQDETGGFTAFICWTFQPGNTLLGRLVRADASDNALAEGRLGACATEERLALADAHEYLRTVSLARIYLDNVKNIQASWVTQGVAVGQLALFFGANDMGSVMMEENVVSAAGTVYCASEREIRRAIEDAGWAPRKRDCLYRIIEAN